MLAFLALIIEQKLGDGTPCLYLSLTMEMAVPRDRNGEYQPRLIRKYQNTVTQDMEEKILSMEEVYAAVFMDAIHYHVRSEGRIVKRAVYIALGIDMNGKKDVLGMYVGENESAKFWLSIMNGFKNRGVEDILIACVDGLAGFPQATEAGCPQTGIRQCIIHQIRNSTKSVSCKVIKKLMSDLKPVYAAPAEETALNEPELFRDKWKRINIPAPIHS